MWINIGKNTLYRLLKEIVIFFQSYYVFQVLNILLCDSKITSNINLLYTQLFLDFPKLFE